MGFGRGFKAEANRITLEIRAKMLLAPTAPIDPDAVCAVFDLEIIKLSSLGCDCGPFLANENGSFSAVTVSCGRKTAIVHNDSHHKYRQRSNICHELAHSFLGHTHVPPLTPNGERSYDGGIEAEANFLAGCLLLPNEAAIYVVKNGLNAVAQEMYGISRSMLDYRLKVSGAHIIHRRSRV